MERQKTKTTDKSSKYELTLAEFPLFNLSKNCNRNEEVIYRDTISGMDGKVIDREWIVSPSKVWGMGSPTTTATLFELFQIWKEDNFQSRTINFGSLYNLLKRLGKTYGHSEYTRLQFDLNCLVGITIVAKNAFWDNKKRTYVDMTFHLFDSVQFEKHTAALDTDQKFSASIKASEFIFESVQKKSLLTTDFDSNFYHSLTPVEQRLSLYLSKVLKTKHSYSREVIKLSEQIPINAKQLKHIKLGINRACQGLIDKGFSLLENWDYKKSADGKTDLVTFYRQGKPFTWIAKQLQPESKDKIKIECLVDDILEVCQDEQSTNYYKLIARKMPDTLIYRALAEVKETSQLGEIKNSKGSIFVHLIKKYAKEQDINL